MSFQWIYNWRSSFAFTNTEFAYFPVRLINDFMLLWHTHDDTFWLFQLQLFIYFFSFFQPIINQSCSANSLTLLFAIGTKKSGTTVSYVNICIGKVAFIFFLSHWTIGNTWERRRRCRVWILINDPVFEVFGVLIRVANCQPGTAAVLPGLPAVRATIFLPSILELVAHIYIKEVLIAIVIWMYIKCSKKKNETEHAPREIMPYFPNC